MKKENPLLLLDADNGAGTGTESPATESTPTPETTSAPAPETTPESPAAPSEGNVEAPNSETGEAVEQTGDADSSDKGAVDQVASALVTKAKVAALTPATPEEDHPLNRAESFISRLEANAHDDINAALAEAVNALRGVVGLIRSII